MLTKHVRTEPNLINREKYYLIPDKLLAVGPNNEVFYFKVDNKSDFKA
jgi:hypothetical protein